MVSHHLDDLSALGDALSTAVYDDGSALALAQTPFEAIACRSKYSDQG